MNSQAQAAILMGAAISLASRIDSNRVTPCVDYIWLAGAENPNMAEAMRCAPFSFDSETIEEANIVDTQSLSQKSELETIFNGLVKKWRDETRWSSMTMRRYAHPAYQSILVLGGREPKDVTKLILKEMQQSPDIWFEALRKLNNTDDPAKNAKTFEEATVAWLTWGRMQGLVS